MDRETLSFISKLNEKNLISFFVKGFASSSMCNEVMDLSEAHQVEIVNRFLLFLNARQHMNAWGDFHICGSNSSCLSFPI